MATKTKAISGRIDWTGLVRAVIRAAWPFLAGAVGGFVSGCSVFGPGVGASIY